jgi:hypothetical protein
MSVLGSKAASHQLETFPVATGQRAPLEPSEATTARGVARPRLHHVDAMRPVKQLGVVGTHSLAFFAPAAGYAVGASVMVTHVTRFAFMFISAAMLVYAYPRLDRPGLKVFWRRRLLAVALPYVAWTVIYFLTELGNYHSAGAAFHQLVYLLLTGYYQLYYLLLLLELCLVYPAFLWLLRRSEAHHKKLLVGSLVLQLVLMSLLHWGLLAGSLGKGEGMTELWNYQLFVVAGGLFAWHYQAVHAFLVANARRIVFWTVLTGLVAEGWVALGESGLPGIGGMNAAAVFQPVVMPFYLGLVVCIYLLGVVLSSRRRSPRFRAAVKVGVDDSYGIYLSQLLIFQGLVFFGFRHLLHVVPWPVVTLAAVAIVFVTSTALTSFLARLPGAKALAGRPRQPWNTLLPQAWRLRVQLLEAAPEAG